MTQQNKIQLFEERKVWTLWDDEHAMTDPQTMTLHVDVAKQGGEVALNARMEFEEKTGKKVVTSLNASSIQKELEE